MANEKELVVVPGLNQSEIAYLRKMAEQKRRKAFNPNDMSIDTLTWPEAKSKIIQMAESASRWKSIDDGVEAVKLLAVWLDAVIYYLKEHDD